MSESSGDDRSDGDDGVGTSYRQALADAHREALAEHPEAFLMGEDIREGVLGLTKGLVDEFGEERVRDVPTSEQAFHGVAIGAAMAGKRPIVEHQINTMSYVAFDQLVNNAAKLRYMTGGQVAVPLTVSVPRSGIIGSYAAQHSDNPYPVLMHYGLKTAVPSTPADAKGLFHAAVAEDDPVFVFSPARAMKTRGAVPDDPREIPLGEADVKRRGADVTVVAIGYTVHQALDAAESLADEIDIEVVDPRTLLPLDEETVFDSVHKTGRVVVVEDANRTCGAAAEIAARIANHCVWSLDAPIKRVTRADVPVSYSPPEEAATTVDAPLIARAARDVLE